MTRRYFPKELSVEEIFFLQVNKLPNDGCWEWTGYLNKTGYGRLSQWKDGKRAHRFSYQYHFGNLDPNLTIDHICRNRKCVNPKHLEQVTMKVNTLRGNTFAAKNAGKTHCKHGHPFSPDNTIIRKGIYGRDCKICQKIRLKKAYLRKLQLRKLKQTATNDGEKCR